MKKRIGLKKTTFDVYLFNLLVFLTTVILVITNLFNRPQGFLVVAVYVETEKIDQLSLDEDVTKVYKKDDYPVFLGDITLEVIDGRVRVEKETSPLHYCSIQGWVKEPGMPIICAPNYFMVVIEDAEVAS
ncbi:MAG: NusG domain II-containing protein [Bacilli bacterium]|jgi:hypothetical protein